MEAEIGQLLKTGLQSVIQSNGLVDTGSLFNSIEVTYNDGEIVIEGNDYFKFLDEEYKLTEQFEQTTEFTQALELISELEIDKRLNEI